MAIAIVGQLVRKSAHGEWAVGTLIAQDQVTHRIVGSVVFGMQEGIAYEVTGEPKKHPKYGDQLDVLAAIPHVEPSRKALLKHLERNFKGVGAKTAQHIVETFEEGEGLEALREILVKKPWKLQKFTTAGSSKAIQLKQLATSNESYLYGALATQFLGNGVSESAFRRLAQWLLKEVEPADDPVSEALAKFHADPYKPIMAVWGYGFASADAIGTSLGIAHDAPCRTTAILYQTLKSASDGEGHTFLPRGIFEDRVGRVDHRIDFEAVLPELGRRGYPVTWDRKGRFYPDSMEHIEDHTAQMLAYLIAPAQALRAFASLEDLQGELRQAESTLPDGIKLDESQRAAVLGILKAGQRLHSLTGGPGCGKTSIMEVVCQMVIGEVAFCAPTGKAARELHARVAKHGYTATTGHQLLEPALGGFQRNQDNPLDADIVIVDETSMKDLVMIWHLLLALKPGAHLVVVGDCDQLASVAAGDVLANIMDMPADHHRLHVTHRNSGEILELIDAVRRGEFVPPKSPLDGPVIHIPLSEPDASTFEMVEGLYLDAVRRGGIENTALLVARRKGRRDTPGWNVTYLNARLQQALNPDGHAIKGTTFRVGDRVIIRKNMPIAQDDGGVVSVVNGDTGKITSADKTEDGKVCGCRLLLDDGRSIRYPVELFDMLNLAFALTVHSAQGSQYLTTIVVMTAGSANFINRRVLYTALSRARRQLVIFGETTLLKEIARKRGPKRFSALVEKVRGLTMQ